MSTEIKKNRNPEAEIFALKVDAEIKQAELNYQREKKALEDKFKVLSENLSFIAKYKDTAEINGVALSIEDRRLQVGNKIVWFTDKNLINAVKERTKTQEKTK